jgi:glycosyltransferase involved in cell wall biosynthesis
VPLSRPAVILATRRPPLPLDNGARIRTHRLLAGLRGACDVTLVTYGDGPTYDDTSTTRAELEASLPGVEVELVHYARRPPRGARRHALHRSSATWAHYGGAGMTEALARLATRRPAVLHLDDPGTGLAGLRVDAALKAFAPHNIEHRIVREVAAERSPSHRAFLELEWRKIRAEERRVHRACDISLAVSEIDAAEMGALGARRVEIVPNGADPATAAPWSPPAAGRPLRLLFVGTVDYWPYELGIAWFVREALPLLRRDGPVVFDVVGAPPLDPVRAPDVVYHGRVPDVHPFYDAAHALVVPVFLGSGTRLKVVEAALLGRPVISTALGTEGLPVEPGRHFLHAEDPEGFARAAAALRTDPERVRALVDAAGTQLEAFVWPRIAERLAGIYADALAQSTRTP